MAAYTVNLTPSNSEREFKAARSAFFFLFSVTSVISVLNPLSSSHRLTVSVVKLS